MFWNHPPLSEWDGDITGYVLSVVERASGSGSEINVSATTSHILKSLHPYYVYTIKVATVTERGQGQFSSAVSARTDVAGKEGWVGGEAGGKRGKVEGGEGRRREEGEGGGRRGKEEVEGGGRRDEGGGGGGG